MSRQIPLDLRWPPHQRLDAFYPGTNQAVLGEVSALVEDVCHPWLFIHGPEGTGKSHLLIGACRALAESDRSARYVSMASVPAPRAAALAAVPATGLVAVDDLQVLAGELDAERALFDLYNRARPAQVRMVFAANASPSALGIALPDLVSRLAACTRCTLHPLDDAGRRAMLRSLAARMGLRLEDEVLGWWFARQPRDPASLVALLQRVDRAALAAQRRVTIPFLRELLK